MANENDLIINVLSVVIAQVIRPSRNAEETANCQAPATPRHAGKLTQAPRRNMKPQTRLLVAVALLEVMVVVRGVAGRDAEYYLNRWNAKNKDMNKVITPTNPPGQIPSPLLSPWSRLPPGATAKAMLAAPIASNASITTQMPADAQLLAPSLYDPPATLPAFPDPAERDPKREWVELHGG